LHSFFNFQLILNRSNITYSINPFTFQNLFYTSLTLNLLFFIYRVLLCIYNVLLFSFLFLQVLMIYLIVLILLICLTIHLMGYHIKIGYFMLEDFFWMLFENLRDRHIFLGHRDCSNWVRVSVIKNLNNFIFICALTKTQVVYQNL